MNRSTIWALPPPGPPLSASETMTMTKPPSQAQKPAAARRGNASERAPTCSGTTATARPSSSGIERAVDEADPEDDEQLGQGVGVEQRVGAVDALGAEQGADDAGAASARSDDADHVAADDLGVGRR